MRMVHNGDLSWLRLFAVLATNPARRLGLDVGTLSPGAPADLIVVDPASAWVLARAKLQSRSKNTPFENARFDGRVVRTLVAGETVFGESGPSGPRYRSATPVLACSRLRGDGRDGRRLDGVEVEGRLQGAHPLLGQLPSVALERAGDIFDRENDVARAIDGIEERIVVPEVERGLAIG
eukprot:gene43504-54592_t